jgi:hypothetical protein
MQAKAQNVTDAVTQCKEQYIHRRERAHDWRDREIIIQARWRC